MNIALFESDINHIEMISRWPSLRHYTHQFPPTDVSPQVVPLSYYFSTFSTNNLVK